MVHFLMLLMQGNHNCTTWQVHITVIVNIASPLSKRKKRVQRTLRLVDKELPLAIELGFDYPDSGPQAVT